MSANGIVVCYITYNFSYFMSQAFRFSIFLYFSSLPFRSYGVISMSIGTGMGAAAVMEYPGGVKTDRSSKL